MKMTVNVTLFFPYSYSGVFRVGGGRAVNPSNFGSVASTWHLVFALFPFRGDFVTLSLHQGI